MGKQKDLTGQRFGKLTVLEKLPDMQDRYCLYLCRCDCGNLVKVNTKRLTRGTVQGCPDCWPSRAKIRLELAGKRYGRLTVLRLAENRKDQRRTWICQCDCGNICEVTTHDLQSGHTTSCGCYAQEGKRLRYRDLTGKTFGWLTVLYPLEGRDYKGSVMWHCRCKCGKECDYSEDALMHGNNVSCGCYRETVLPKMLNEHLHRIDGTCVEHLKRKMRADNTSGHIGVYPTRAGHWAVYIGFKGKKYYLGTYEKKSDALAARLKGEEMHDEFLDWYYKEYLPAHQSEKIKQKDDCREE